MTYFEGYTKIVYRLNKSATADFSNIDKDPASEAINKALSDWIRRTVHGINIPREGSEESRMRIDDLQPLLSPPKKIAMTDKGVYSEGDIPKDYRYFNRLFFTHKDDCGSLDIGSDIVEDSNVNVYLTSDGKRPSLDFEQCFHIISGKKFKIYHNKEFEFSESTLSYYKNPKKYNANKPDEVFELKDDVMELVIDEAAKIIAGDTTDQFQYQRNGTSVEGNN